MTVLSKREVWRKPTPRTLPPGQRSPDFTDEERANVRRALRFLRVRVGSGTKLSALLRVSITTLGRLLSSNGKPGASIAFKAARLAGVSVEAVVGGAWPPEGACPHCGRSDS